MDKIEQLVNAEFSGLFSEIKKYIITSEQQFTGDTKIESFLWEHTLQVANISFKLSEKENLNPIIPILTALFHDAGKFVKGQYHKKDIAEEEDSIKVARKLLAQFNSKQETIENITKSLSALYNEKKENNLTADIVHDSDFIVKFGYTGIATLFQKATLRGITLGTTAYKTFSKEYTYALSLENNMRTQSAKKIAREKSHIHIDFLDNLINELNTFHNLQLKKQNNSLPCPKNKNKQIHFVLVFKDTCHICQQKLTLTNQIEKGLKCTKLISILKCKKCNNESTISFCLPELCGE